jgi:hypothetical protein
MNNLFYLFLICTSVLISSSAYGDSRFNEQKLKSISKSRYWHLLLHYRTTLLGLESSADGEGFFFSPEGKTNPLKELKASIAAFNNHKLKLGPSKRHPQCSFPERYRFLKEKLNLKFKEPPCKDYKQWIKSLNAKSISLIFASNFPNNPGSAFGHTFLRINSYQKGIKRDLLDYGISYAAITTGENMFFYAAKGLLGGYIGRFSMMPYYRKVNEYSNIEDRDIWEYELNINSEETNRLLGHLWEVESNTYFQYYFLNENCSALILTFLEISKPNWDLSSGYSLFTLPADTIKRIKDQNNSIVKVEFRPSLYKKMLQLRDALTDNQRETFKSIVNRRIAVETVKNPLILETTTAFFLHKKIENKLHLNPVDKALYRRTLIARSKLGPIDLGKLPKISRDSKPELSHHSMQLGTSFGSNNAGKFQELHFKAGLHDFLNLDQGYDPSAKVDFLQIRARYNHKNSSRNAKLLLEEFKFLNFTSLPQFDLQNQLYSWDVLVTYLVPKDLGCDSCHTLKFKGGAGVATNFFGSMISTYLLGTANIELGQRFEKKYRLGPGVKMGLLFRPHKIYKLSLSYQNELDLFQDEREKIHHLFQLEESICFSQSLDLRLLLSKIHRKGLNSYEIKLAANYYF